ncbi:MAG: hypothetical protein K9L59_06630 [Desulfobacterales bacterium]|nr:hypothetical protein [Desulfobacterales bacterium]
MMPPGSRRAASLFIDEICKAFHRQPSLRGFAHPCAGHPADGAGADDGDLQLWIRKLKFPFFKTHRRKSRFP